MTRLLIDHLGAKECCGAIGRHHAKDCPTEKIIDLMRANQSRRFGILSKPVEIMPRVQKERIDYGRMLTPEEFSRVKHADPAFYKEVREDMPVHPEQVNWAMLSKDYETYVGHALKHEKG